MLRCGWSAALFLCPIFYPFYAHLIYFRRQIFKIAVAGFRCIFCYENGALSRIALRRIVNLLLDISPFSTLFYDRKAHTTTIYTNIRKQKGQVITA